MDAEAFCDAVINSRVLPARDKQHLRRIAEHLPPEKRREVADVLDEMSRRLQEVLPPYPGNLPSDPTA